jgi:hypothetical protein
MDKPQQFCYQFGQNILDGRQIHVDVLKISLEITNAMVICNSEKNKQSAVTFKRFV